MQFQLKTAVAGVAVGTVGYGEPVVTDTGEARYAILFPAEGDRVDVRVLLGDVDVLVTDTSTAGEERYSGS